MVHLLREQNETVFQTGEPMEPATTTNPSPR
jgi:hypothetical protein